MSLAGEDRSSTPTNRPNQAPLAAPAIGRPAPGQPAEHVLDHLEVGADDRHVLHRELLVGEEVDGALRLDVGVVGADHLTARDVRVLLVGRHAAILGISPAWSGGRAARARVRAPARAPPGQVGQHHQDLVLAPASRRCGAAAPAPGGRSRRGRDACDAELGQPCLGAGPLGGVEVLPHDRVPHHGRRALAQLEPVQEVGGAGGDHRRRNIASQLEGTAQALEPRLLVRPDVGREQQPSLGRWWGRSARGRSPAARRPRAADPAAAAARCHASGSTTGDAAGPTEPAVGAARPGTGRRAG